MVCSLLAVALTLVLVSSLGLAQEAQPEAAGYSYAFTYQGQLKNGGGPLNGTCDFRFGLWNAVSGPTQIGATQEVPNVTLADGLFTARLNFGAAAHTGGARWLEIALRCPAGSGSYTTLTPRQELTAAPAALALALPFEAGGSSSGPLLSFWNSNTGPALELASQSGRGLYVDSAGDDGVHVHQAGTPSTTTASADKNGFEVAGAQGHGLWVGRANLDGVMVYSAGDDGMTVAFAGGDGLRVESAGDSGVQVDLATGHGLYVKDTSLNGLQIDSATFDGIQVLSAGGDGIELSATTGHGVYVANAALHGLQVDSAGYNGANILHATDDGVYVERAGTAATVTPSSHRNGFEVAGAEGNGLYVGAAGINGVWVESAANGVAVYSADEYGLYVSTAGDDGLYVSSATNDGVGVGAAGDDGVYVNHAGSPSSSTAGSDHNGFEVAGAQGNGLYVGRADQYGVNVNSAFSGIFLNSIGNNGLYVNSAGTNGVWIESAGVNGMYVARAADDGVDVAGTRYAGNFRGSINVTGSCVGCQQAVFGLNTSDRALQPGDIVAVQGIQATALDNAPALWRVVPAGGSEAVVGVVSGRAELDLAAEGEQIREGETGQRLVPGDGLAQPGEYLTIVISGPMRVRASAPAGSIEAGMRLAVTPDGLARPLKTTVVEGVTLSESAPLFGIALDRPDQDGLVWVLVNPQ